jgi:hypothetical protein
MRGLAYAPRVPRHCNANYNLSSSIGRRALGAVCIVGRCDNLLMLLSLCYGSKHAFGRCSDGNDLHSMVSSRVILCVAA